MKITVFTSNQPRHINLITELAQIADEVYAVQECNTVFPGEVKDFFNKSQVMQDYFKRVIAAEKDVFGSIKFLPSNVKQLAIKSGDLNRISLDVLESALHSDIYVVFGASYIKAPLIDRLVDRNAINIHMGVSPYYRGSSCNFWAPYGGHPELVGATIHILSRGLDSGDILYHALPKPQKVDAFVLGMKAVKVAHDSLVERIKDGTIFNYEKIPQDKSKEIKYTKNIEFNDDVAIDYLENQDTPEEIYRKLMNRDMSMFNKPFIG